MKVTLCAGCGVAALRAPLAEALAQAGLTAEVVTTDCMSGCSRPGTLAFRAAGKMAYLFGDIGAEDLADLITFARLYAAAPDGRLADARPLGRLRTKAIARIPA